MKAKNFVILSPVGAGEYVFHESILGTLDEAQDALKNATYNDGEYRIAEIVTRVNKATVKVEPEVKITFEPTRKRPRKEKAGK